jgi:hypothetical protein
MTETLRGNLAAIEYLLGQLFVYALENNPDPQRWVRDNVEDITDKLSRREKFSDDQRYAAEQTVLRVMRMTSNTYEALGHGPAIEG